ncbi:Protein of unknown function [Gryllus bimaculatus]|nr:Protein of unknown function [Gryllus bimaculatus]
MCWGWAHKGRRGRGSDGQRTKGFRVQADTARGFGRSLSFIAFTPYEKKYMVVKVLANRRKSPTNQGRNVKLGSSAEICKVYIFVYTPESANMKHCVEELRAFF